MTRDQRQGWALFAAMSVIFLGGVATLYWAESHGNAAHAGLTAQPAGHLATANLEGKEVRDSAWPPPPSSPTVTTDASCGAVNALHDSLTPLGGLVPLVATCTSAKSSSAASAPASTACSCWSSSPCSSPASWSGRTPEYLGKKIEASGDEAGHDRTSSSSRSSSSACLRGRRRDHDASGWHRACSTTRPARPSEILYAFTSGQGQQRLGLRRPQRQHPVVQHSPSASRCWPAASSSSSRSWPLAGSW